MSFAFWVYVALNAIFAVSSWSASGTGYTTTMTVVVTAVISLVVIYLPLKLIGKLMRGRRD